MSASVPGPDVAQLGAEALPEAAFPAPRETGLRIYMDPAAHEDITRHARENQSVEICGVLVGVWKRDPAGPYAHVTASIRGDAATSKFTEVTFTHETWARINERMDRDFSDRAIVGWYHTHPDFGVFLSDRDLFIHQHFFNSPGQVALVVDPVRRESGVFIWKRGKPELAPLYQVGSTEHWAPRSSEGVPPEAAEPRASAAPARVEPAGAGQPAGSLLLLAGIGLLAMGYLLGNYRVAADRQLVADALARQLLDRTDDPIMLQNLRDINAALDGVRDESRRLVPGEKDAKPPKVQEISDAIAGRVARAREALDRAAGQIGMRPEQQAAIDLLVALREQERAARQKREQAASGPASRPAESRPAPRPQGG